MVDDERRRLLRLGLTAAGTVLGGGVLVWSRFGDTDSPSDDPVANSASTGVRRPSSTEPATTSTTEPPPPEDETSTTEPPPEEETAAPSEAPPAAAALTVLCRDAWGAAPAGEPMAAHQISRVMVHHTATALEDAREAPSRMRSHQSYHQRQGFRDIAYHLVVDVAGNVYEGRDPSQPGETFTDYDPTGWFLVTCEGNFDGQALSDAQFEGLAVATAWSLDAFALTADSVRAHRDVAQTSCPGGAIYARFTDGSLLARVSELTGQVARTDLCGEEGRSRVAAIEAGRA